MVDQEGGSAPNLSRVLKDIASGRPVPCYLLFGEEEFLVKTAQENLLNALLPPGERDLNLFSLDGETADAGQIAATLMTPPLLPGRKVVLVDGTPLLQSKKTLPDLEKSVREHLDRNPARAIRDFMLLLHLAGWHLEDLAADGWKKISPEEWNRTVGGEGAAEREAWLPRVLDACLARGRDAVQGAEATEPLEAVLREGLPEGNHLILTAEAVDKRKRLFHVIAECGVVLEFSPVKGEAKQKQRLQDAVREKIAQSGKKLTPKAWLALGEKTGFQLRATTSALDTLLTYVGDKVAVDEADVEAAVGKSREGTVFALTAALDRKDGREALLVLKDLFDQGVNPLVILAVMAREIRNLLHARLLIDSGRFAEIEREPDYGRFQKQIYPEIKSALGVAGKKEGGLAGQHPYVVYQALKNARRFKAETLVDALEALAEMDLAFKSTPRDPALALERFILRFCP